MIQGSPSLGLGVGLGGALPSSEMVLGFVSTNLLTEGRFSELVLGLVLTNFKVFRIGLEVGLDRL